MGIFGTFNVNESTIKIIPLNHVNEDTTIPNNKYFSNGARGPLQITGETQDKQHFVITGNSTGRNLFRTEKVDVTRIEVGDKNFKLSKSLEISLDNDKIDKGSLKDIKKLVEEHSLGNAFGRIKLIEEQKTSSLDNNHAMKTAMAQAKESADNFKSAFNTVPSKPQSDSKYLS